MNSLTEMEIANGQHKISQPRDEYIDNPSTHLGDGDYFKDDTNVVQPHPDIQRALSLSKEQRLAIAKGKLRGLTEADVEDLQNNTDVPDALDNQDINKQPVSFFTMTEIFIIIGMVGVGAIGFKLATKK